MRSLSFKNPVVMPSYCEMFVFVSSICSCDLHIQNDERPLSRPMQFALSIMINALASANTVIFFSPFLWVLSSV
jgi:hypothetical protein